MRPGLGIAGARSTPSQIPSESAREVVVSKRRVLVAAVGVAIACLLTVMVSRRLSMHLDLMVEEIGSLRSELAELKRQSSLNAGLVALGESARLNRVAPVAQADTPAATRPETPQASADKDKDKVDEGSEEKIVEHTNQRFRSEPIDGEWSATGVREVRSAMARELPAGSQLLNIECRSTLCRIEASHRDLDGYRKFADSSFLSAEKMPWKGGFLSSVTEQTGSRVSSVSYHWREGT
jgi:hypothetical protein